MKASQINWEKYIIPAGVVVAGYLILKHFDLFGPSAVSQNNAETDATTAAAVDAAIKQDQASGGFSTMSDSQAAGIANGIYTAGINGDAYAAERQIIQVNTKQDLLKVIKAFGTKQAAESTFSSCYLLGIGCNAYNLTGWFHLPFMDSSTLNTINNYLSSQGIDYNF